MNKRLALRIVVYLLGLLVLSFGVALAITSGLGVSPINSLPFVLSLIAGVTPGTTAAIVLVIFIAAQFALLRRDLPLINVTQILAALVFGLFLDVALFIVGDFTLPTYAGQLAKLLVSIIIIAFGVSIYMEAQLILLPTEGIVTAVARKIGKPFPRTKVIFDCVMVATSLTLSLVFLDELSGVREGTVFSALLVGRTIPLAKSLVTRILGRIGFYVVE